MGICDKGKNNIENTSEGQQKPSMISKYNSNQHETNIYSNNNNNFNNNIQKKEENNMNIKPEMGFIEYPKALNRNQYKIIDYQMGNSVCKIINGKIIGTGFICLIPFPTIDHPLKVLITCNHVFNDIRIRNKIKLKFDNNIEKEIILDKERKLYTNDIYDITIIELKDNEFDLNNYLRIDDELYKNEEIKENDQIYIIHYPKEVKYSIGPIIYREENKIGYKCETEEGSSGAPIFNLNNFNVIGIHRGVGIDKKFNIGEILKLPINDFYQNYKCKNEILITLEINIYDINKKIYFLNNIDYKDDFDFDER